MKEWPQDNRETESGHWCAESLTTKVLPRSELGAKKSEARKSPGTVVGISMLRLNTLISFYCTDLRSFPREKLTGIHAAGTKKLRNCPNSTLTGRYRAVPNPSHRPVVALQIAGLYCHRKQLHAGLLPLGEVLTRASSAAVRNRALASGYVSLACPTLITIFPWACPSAR